MVGSGARTRKKNRRHPLEPVTCPAHSRARKPRVRLASSRRCLSRASLKPRPSPQARRRARAASARRPRAPSRPRAVRVPSFSAPGHLFREPSRIPRRARRRAAPPRAIPATPARSYPGPRPTASASPRVGRARLGGRVRRARRNLRLRRGPHRRPHLSAPFSARPTPSSRRCSTASGSCRAVYAALLLPGGKDQPRLKPNVPVAASFALGFFRSAVPDFLGEQRDVAGSVRASDLGWSHPRDPRVQALRGVQRRVRGVSHRVRDHARGRRRRRGLQDAVDRAERAVLRVVVRPARALARHVRRHREDQKRRGVFSAGKAAAFAAVPVLGPCLWLVARPKLPE